MTTTTERNYRIVSIEGNIGSGKSTLMGHLKNQWGTQSHILFLREPVDEWEQIQDEQGQSMLQKFYKDQTKYSFPFQMMAYISRLEIIKQAVDQCKAKPETQFIIVTERCLHTDKFVFANMLHKQEHIEDVCYQIYMRWFDVFAKEYQPDWVVHVDTSPDVCLARIHQRSRTGEGGIPLAYLQECHQYHLDMMHSLTNNVVQIITLDGNQDMVQQPETMQQWMAQMEPCVQLSSNNHVHECCPMHNYKQFIYQIGFVIKHLKEYITQSPITLPLDVMSNIQLMYANYAECVAEECIVPEADATVVALPCKNVSRYMAVYVLLHHVLHTIEESCIYWKPYRHEDTSKIPQVDDMERQILEWMDVLDKHAFAVQETYQLHLWNRHRIR